MIERSKLENYISWCQNPLKRPNMGSWCTVMLVTTLCRWIYDGDRFNILATESLCWRLSSCWWCLVYQVIGHQHLKIVTLFVSNICHQHRCSLIFYLSSVTSDSYNAKWIEETTSVFEEGRKVENDLLSIIPSCIDWKWIDGKVMTTRQWVISAPRSKS